MDAVLRGVLPLRAVSAAPAHQRLPGALDAEEIQTAEDVQESARGMGAGHCPVSPVVRALEMDDRALAGRVRRARCRERVTPGFCGSPGLKCPGPPDPRRGL